MDEWSGSTRHSIIVNILTLSEICIAGNCYRGKNSCFLLCFEHTVICERTICLSTRVYHYITVCDVYDLPQITPSLIHWQSSRPPFIKKK